MDTSRLCMYCMQDNQGMDVCPHCGKNAAAPLLPNHLTPGEILGGRFLVGRAVGQDPLGVVYMVYDLRKENKLKIREYLPRNAAYRNPGDTEVQIEPGMQTEYQEGLTRMLTRAESPEDPTQAMAHFEENGTLYVVLRRQKAAAAAVPEQERPVRRSRPVPAEESYDEE